jgi:hypothetical protein
MRRQVDVLYLPVNNPEQALAALQTLTGAVTESTAPIAE